MIPTPARFTATHEITLTRDDGVRTVIPVMAVAGCGFTQDDVRRADAPTWIRDGRSWRPRLGAIASSSSLSAHRLGRGSDPRGAERADVTFHIRVSSAALERFAAAAEHAGARDRTAWARDMLERAAAAELNIEKGQ